MSQEKIFHKIIGELCLELGIKVENKSCGWILKLQKDNKVKHIIGTKFPLNPESSGAIASDKYATYEILRSFDIPIIEHTILFNPKTRSSYVQPEGNEYILSNEIYKHKKIVIKPNHGSEGVGVSLCKTLKEAENTALKLFETNSSISICPYYDIKTEYRTFYLNGKVLLIYAKTKPFVIGDGFSKIKDLIKKLNLPDKLVVKENLSILDMEKIPQNGEKIEISWKHNLSGGATATLLKKGELYSEIEKLAIKAGKAIDVKFATIDVIHTYDDKLLIMEVNSGVAVDIFAKTVENGYELSKGIYREALKEMFD